MKGSGTGGPPQRQRPAAVRTSAATRGVRPRTGQARNERGPAAGTARGRTWVKEEDPF